MVLSLERINKAREAGYDDDKIISSIEQRDPEFSSRIKKAREAGYDSQKIMQSIEKRLSSQNASNSPVIPQNSQTQQVFSESPSSQPFSDNSPNQASQSQQFGIQNQPKSPAEGIAQTASKMDHSLVDSFKSGFKSSASGEISKAVFNNKSEEQIAQDPGFWEQLVHQGGEIAGDAPYLLAGSTLGASLGASLGSVGGPVGATLGGVVGGGFGAMAMPAFIKESLKEYRDYVDKGNDLTFGEFLTKADKVAGKTLNQGVFGAILGSINKALPLLTKIPGVGKLFESKIAQKTAGIAAESTAAATIPPISEGRLPTSNDFAQALGLVLGLNALHLPAAIRDKIQERGKDSGLSPEEFAKTPEAKEILKEVEKSKDKPLAEGSALRKPETKQERLARETKEIDQQFSVNEQKPINLLKVGDKFITRRGEEATLTKINDKIFEFTAGKRVRSGPISSLSGEMKGPETKASSIASSIAIKPKELSLNQKIKETTKKSIVESTGKSAEEKIQQPKTSTDKIIETSNEVIKAAKTPGESLKKMGSATNEAIFNILAPLEKAEKNIPVGERVTTRIKLAQSAASEINATLENGIFSNVTNGFTSGSLKDAYGSVPWKKISKGLKPGEYSLSELDAYRVSKASLKRQKEGKKTGVDTDLARHDVERFKNKYGPIDQRIREFQKATLNEYGKDLLGKELIDVWNNDYYAPLFRVMDSGKDSLLQGGSLQPKQPFKKMKGSERNIVPPSESDIYNTSMLIRNARKNDAILQYKKSVEKGQLPGKVKMTKNDPIPDEVLKDLDIDTGMKDITETLYNQTRKESFAPRKNILRGWEGGKPFEIEVPEDIYNTFSTLAPQDYGIVAKAFQATNRLFSKGISMAPRKFASIVSRDALSSLIYSRTGSNPISVFQALGDIYNSKDTYKKFLALGGDVYASKLSERIERSHKVEDLITPGKKGILVPFEKIGQFFSKMGDTMGSISLAVPYAEFKRSLEKFGDTPEGRLMAAMEARRVTYDPTRKGGSKIVRELGNFIPFWNVSLQDFSSLGQGLKRKETWVKGITAITVPTLMLKMINEDNPDYQSLNPVDKAAFWHMYFGDKHVRIPIPWLLGVNFKVGPEMFFDMAKGRGKEGWEGLYHSFVDNLSGDIPPLLQAFSESTIGKSLPSPLGTVLGTESNAPDVVPRRLQNLPSEQQYTAKTSQVAKWFGSMWGISPVKIEKFAKTIGGLVAADVLALTDEIAYATGLAEDKRPEQKESNYLLLGTFLTSGPPSRTKYANEFYEYLDESKRTKAGGNQSKEYQNINLNKYNSKISSLFRNMREIEDSKLSGKEKKRQLDQKQIEITKLYKEAVDSVKKEKSKKGK